MSHEDQFVAELDRQPYEGLYHPGTTMPRWPVLLDRIEVALLRGRRYGRSVGLLVLNDVTTVDGADIWEVARILQPLVGVDDTIALGPDNSTLVLVCATVDNAEHARVIAHELLEEAGVMCRVEMTFSDAADEPGAFLARAFGVAVLNSDLSKRLAIPQRTEQLMAAMALIDEILVCKAQLHGTVGAERRAQLESAIAGRAEMIKRYLDAMDRS